MISSFVCPVLGLGGEGAERERERERDQRKMGMVVECAWLQGCDAV